MFGNGLDMRGVDSTFNSKIAGGVRIIRPTAGGFNGPGGVWEDGDASKIELLRVNVQPARWKRHAVSDRSGAARQIPRMRV